MDEDCSEPVLQSLMWRLAFVALVAAVRRTLARGSREYEWLFLHVHDCVCSNEVLGRR